MIYLDNAATSAKKPLCVFGKLFYESLFTSVNAGRGAHSKSLRAVNGINKTAEIIAKLINIDDPSSIAFTPNATYAINLAMLGLLNPGDHVIVTAMDHNSVLRPAAHFGEFTIVDADDSGFINPKDIEAAIRPETTLIVCTHVSNVCGSIQPVEEIGKISKKYGIHFLLDASQSIGCMEVDAKKIGADLIAFAGHKGLLGPLGTGALYVENESILKPVITGGTGSLSESLIQPRFMPDMLHTGTINTPAVMALGTAASCIEDPNTTHGLEKELAELFIEDLLCMNGVSVYGPLKNNRNGTVSFNINSADPAEVEDYLDKQRKIIVRSGYHCAPIAHKVLGSDKKGSVRASFGYFNTNYDRIRLTDAIYNFLKGRK